jgi:hypothetical protein
LSEPGSLHRSIANEVRKQTTKAVPPAIVARLVG